MKNYQDTCADIFSHAKVLPAVEMAPLSAIGHSVAHDVKAPLSNPPFDNAAMDGVAFHHKDTQHASTTNPIYLPLIGMAAAGDKQAIASLKKGEAAEIMTGATMPKGADTVMPIETVERVDNQLVFTKPYPAKKHVRQAGEDIKKGEVAIPKGMLLKPQHIPLLTALGLETISVHPHPKAVWLATGRELVDDPQKPLNAHQIYNSSSPYGAAILPALGADLLWQKTVSDDGVGFTKAVQKAMEDKVDIIISTGAVSVGVFDFVRRELESMGAKIIVHGAKVRPGKPILFALLPNGAFFFGLPGNPVSTAACLRAFVAPFLALCGGSKVEQPITAILEKDSNAPMHLTVFQKAMYHLTEQGTLSVTALMGQESFKVRPMVYQNCWLIHPEGKDILTHGEKVAILPFTPNIFD